jgi:hypothetical protein
MRSRATAASRARPPWQTPPGSNATAQPPGPPPHSRRKVRQVLAQAQPRPYTRSKPPPAPVLGTFHTVIDAILADDEQAPPKQRHTAMQLYRRLRDQYGYAGGYDRVRRYVGKHRRDHRETFIPLAHDPGVRLKCDFGHIQVDFPDGRPPLPVLIAAWAYSNYPFALALPTKRTEAILAGVVAAFDLATSNLAFGEWGQVFQGERMTAALLDRLTHRCHIVEMNGESFRFRESMKSKKGKKAEGEG